jgi:hypothetical protein
VAPSDEGTKSEAALILQPFPNSRFNEIGWNGYARFLEEMDHLAQNQPYERRTLRQLLGRGLLPIGLE